MKMFNSLNDRLKQINKRGIVDTKFALPIALIGLLISVVFIITILPTMISNLTGFGVENLSTGLYHNGTAGCPLALFGDTVALDNCTFIPRQTTGASSVLYTIILPLFVAFMIFVLVLSKLGVNIKGLEMK